jgi:hypothetical protein
VRSVLGFAWNSIAARMGGMAPVYTPLIWLVGIGLIGDTLFLPGGYSPWVHIGLSAAFPAFPNIHAWVVYKRNS